ncbi:aminoacyl-tRNA hydrolase [Actinomyces vulturis]|uniref:aminoacyl-tRNA hydrolase n=1 Tax=Actinomyces vulturis TaxID=1857645 RepID=UPI000834E37A|nr:aminoacyl-tRNA hydrolase [Actinomyces vulturis]
MSDLWVVVGLGNPDLKYQKDRHNVGQMVLNLIAEQQQAKFTSHRARAQVLDTRLGVIPGGAPGPRVILAKSQTYMNTSGGPVRALLDYYNVAPDHLLVLHDDMDLPEHALRLKNSGGEGGHNGLKSISSHLGTRDYGRLRIGVGRPPGRMDPADYVLSPFPKNQTDEWAVTIGQAVDVIQDVVIRGFTAAQMDLHSRN